MSASADDDRFEPARGAWAGRFQAVLTTNSEAEPGYPFPSMVPYCLDHTGQALLLLSQRAQHTRNLAADRRCGFLVNVPTDGDVHQSTRLAALGELTAADPGDEAAYCRWFRYFPHTLPYFEQMDFHLYRFTPRRLHFNGGFGTARWLSPDQVLRVSPFDDAAETAILGALQDLAQPLCAHRGGSPNPKRLAGIDPWGADMTCGERLLRIDLPGTTTEPEPLRRSLTEVIGSKEDG